MKKSLLLILLLTFSIAFSQIRFEKAYYINNAGERTEILLKNEDWNFNPTSFSYKLNKDGAVSTGKIGNVKEFGVYNFSKYIRYIGPIDQSTDNLQRLDDQPNPVYQNETVFLKQLNVGERNLYIYNSEKVVKFFYSDKETPVTPLVYKRYFPNGDTASYATNNEYKNQLKQYFKGENADAKIEKLEYKPKTLISFFESYYPNTYGDSENSDSDGSIFNINLKAGISFASVDYIVPANSAISLKYDSKINPTFAVELEYILPFRKNKFSVFFTPTFQTYEQSGMNSTISKSEVKYTAIEIPVGIRYYMFVSKNSRFFIDGLVNVANLKLGDNMMNYELSTLSIQRDFTLNTQRPNFGIGVGFNYKNRWSIQARQYTTKAILIDYQYINGNYKNFSLMVGYNIL